MKIGGGCDGGCGQVVRVLAFYSDNSSLNPAEVDTCYCVKIETNKRRGREWPIKKYEN